MAMINAKPNDLDSAARIMTPVIYKMAHKYARNHKARDFDDLVQDGYEGLMKAYHKYDGSFGAAFSTYAYQWIFAHISDRANHKHADYNQTSGTSYEDHNLGTYTLPLDELIDAKRSTDNMDATAKAIHTARQQGFTYREISEAMATLGKKMSLHQVRNYHLNALEA